MTDETPRRRRELVDVTPLLREAYRKRDWVALGYDSWESYVAHEFSAERLGIDVDAHAGLSRMLSSEVITGRVTDDRSVYFIQADNGGLIKIGVAKDVTARLYQIQLMCPVRLVVLATVPGGGAALEAELHQRFADARRHGEWFEPTQDLLAFIAEAGGLR